MNSNSEKFEEYISKSQPSIDKYEFKRIKYKKCPHNTIYIFIFFVFILLSLLFIILQIRNDLRIEQKKKINNTNNITIDWEKEKLVIHALGIFNNYTYTNSFEALNYWYFQKKMHLMEADFYLTSDNHIVLSHDFSHMRKTPNLTEFKQSHSKGNLTSMTFEDLVVFMEKHQDLYIITDTKFKDIPRIKLEFDDMAEILSHHKNVNERFIIQVYNEKMFLFLNENKYPFKLFIFTLYQRWNGRDYKDLENIFSFCAKHKLKGIVVHKKLFNNKIYNLSNIYSIPIYLHTENSIIKIAEYLQKVKGVYTDEINNNALEEYLSNQTKL